jgi:hypothetical protein
MGWMSGFSPLVTFPIHQVVEDADDPVVLRRPDVGRDRPVLLDQPVEPAAEVVVRQFERWTMPGQETLEFAPQGLDRNARGFRDDAQGDGTAEGIRRLPRGMDHIQHLDRVVRWALIQRVTNPSSQCGILGARQDFEDRRSLLGGDALEPRDCGDEVGTFGPYPPGVGRQHGP